MRGATPRPATNLTTLSVASINHSNGLLVHNKVSAPRYPRRSVGQFRVQPVFSSFRLSDSGADERSAGCGSAHPGGEL